MPLPASWVDELFSKLALRYGAAFSRQYADLDPRAVKADWAEVLEVFCDHPHALGHGLGLLPADRPPNALQFRALCIDALREERQPAPPALPAPKANPKLVAAAIGSIERNRVRDPRAWARALKAREEAETDETPPRNRLTPFQRQAWRDVLGTEATPA